MTITQLTKEAVRLALAAAVADIVPEFGDSTAGCSGRVEGLGNAVPLVRGGTRTPLPRLTDDDDPYERGTHHTAHYSYGDQSSYGILIYWLVCVRPIRNRCNLQRGRLFILCDIRYGSILVFFTITKHRLRFLLVRSINAT